MEKEITIGQLIENEVRRQQWSITRFAEAICCQRSNVYDIFSRNSIDIVQLELISRVLNHNFFKDLADNPKLAAIGEETEEQAINRKAVNQFLDVMPRVLKRLGLSPIIVYAPSVDDDPLPDYGLTDKAIFFTIGNRMSERYTEEEKQLLFFDPVSAPNDAKVDYVFNRLHGTGSVNIVIDYKTEEEWDGLMRFVLITFWPKKS